MPALTDEAVLVCQYGGMINVRSAAKSTITTQAVKKKNPLPRETAWLNKNAGGKLIKYVTMADLKKLGWINIQDYYFHIDEKTKKKKKNDWLKVHKKIGNKDIFDPDPVIDRHYRKVTNYDIINLNRVLIKYNITTYERICLFMAQITHECGAGDRMCERTGTDEHPFEDSVTRSNMNEWYLKYNLDKKGKLKYPYQYRGGGAIQLTHDYNYKDFYDVVKDKNIMSGTEYVAFNYPWLSAGVFWNLNNLDKYVGDFKGLTRKINGGYENYADREKIYKKCRDVFKRYK